MFPQLTEQQQTRVASEILAFTSMIANNSSVNEEKLMA